MSRIDFPVHDINQTYGTVRFAWDHADNPLLSDTGSMGSVNISDIETRLIQDAGRFAERYASDLLVTLDHVRNLCENVFRVDGNDIDEIFVFAIRKDGVDHGTFFMQRACSDINPFQPYMRVEPYYRRVLGIRVHVTTDCRVTCELKDLTCAFNRPNPVDFNEEGKLLAVPFAGGNPVPVDIYKPPYVEEKRSGVEFRPAVTDGARQ